MYDCTTPFPPYSSSSSSSSSAAFFRQIGASIGAFGRIEILLSMSSFLLFRVGLWSLSSFYSSCTACMHGQPDGWMGGWTNNNEWYRVRKYDSSFLCAFSILTFFWLWSVTQHCERYCRYQINACSVPHFSSEWALVWYANAKSWYIEWSASPAWEILMPW